jgi:transglutaminase-like putative cysteine protease
MDRRNFLTTTAALLATSAAASRTARAQVRFAPTPGTWREYGIVTRIKIANPKGKTQAWIPVPCVETDWFKSGDSTWTTNAQAATLKRDSKSGVNMVHAEWREGETAPSIDVVSRVSTQDRAVDLSKPGNPVPLSDEDRQRHLAATSLIPTGGIVKEFSNRITAGAQTDVEKARRIYEWIVENTFRNSATRGCGIGDVASMLQTGNLNGKCADLNALGAGLARAAGLPARDIYGLRVAPSKFGYKSLGAGSSNATKAQHCRAEVYLSGFGWVPMDPADVRKVILEEPPGNLQQADPKVIAVRHALFGSWEGNWLAYNFGNDVALPGAKGPIVDFLMYPEAESGGERLDCLDADSFKYVIVSRDLAT